MKIAYYPDTDSMYIDLSAKSSVESKEVSSGVVLDFDSDGNIVGIDIDNASKKLDLSEIILNKIPADKKTIAACFQSSSTQSDRRPRTSIRI